MVRFIQRTYTINFLNHCFLAIVGLGDGKIDSKVVKSFYKSKMLIPGCHITLGNIIGQG